jgi:uncharacterized SAM-binding protein YcdF (DUF218 family)
MISRRSRKIPSAQSGGALSSLVTFVAFVVVCGILFFARHPIFRFAGESWIVEDKLERSDAIIVLSDDNFYADRATRAAQVYRQGLAPVVVASGRRLRPYAGIAELMEHDLVERGVPKEKIVRAVHDADSTRMEAQALAQVAIQHKWRSFIIVTSNYHTRRARYIFEHVFPAGSIIHVSGARDGDFDPDSWWERRISVKEFVRELAAMVVAIWEAHSRHETPAKAQVIVDPCGCNPQLMV